MTPLPVLRQAPMRWQRSAAPRIPPSAKCRCVAQRLGAAAAPGRAGATVSGGGVDHHARVEAARRVEQRA